MPIEVSRAAPRTTAAGSPAKASAPIRDRGSIAHPAASIAHPGASIALPAASRRPEATDLTGDSPRRRATDSRAAFPRRRATDSRVATLPRVLLHRRRDLPVVSGAALSGAADSVAAAPSVEGVDVPSAVVVVAATSVAVVGTAAVDAVNHSGGEQTIPGAWRRCQAPGSFFGRDQTPKTTPSG